MVQRALLLPPKQPDLTHINEGSGVGQEFTLGSLAKKHFTLNKADRVTAKFKYSDAITHVSEHENVLRMLYGTKRIRFLRGQAKAREVVYGPVLNI